MNRIKQPIFVRFRLQDRILFMKRLGMIMRSGIPLMEALRMLGDESRTRSSTYIYKSLIADVSNGQSLSSGLARFERHFGEFCVNIIRVGEASGTLRENLEYLAEDMKRKQALRRKVVGALVYPAVIVVATIGIVTMLTIYIFPKIIPIFASVKTTLPLSTRVLITISNFLSAWGVLLFFGVAAFVFCLIFLMRIPNVRYWFDHLLLHIPLFGALSRYYNLANISRTMALLLRSDVRIVAALDLAAASTRDLAYRRALVVARDRVIQGQDISQYFRQSPRLFPEMFVQMIVIGESTGSLSDAFEYSAEIYEEEISELTKNLTTLLEPVLMIVMGLIVGFIAVSIITPIYSITQSLGPR
ncbi:type II secretion system F family protein [Candidatus Kaiserbacteria bacterium]|nr:type II secretion system F family protein [Candidatus Kaiserbacteria bacterium]